MSVRRPMTVGKAITLLQKLPRDRRLIIYVDGTQNGSVEFYPTLLDVMDDEGRVLYTAIQTHREINNETMPPRERNSKKKDK